MYSSPGQPGEVKSYCYVYLPSKYYLFFQYVNLLDGCFFLNKRTVITDLRWLWQRGSPLPIPNREVKPVSADGTANCGRVCRRLFYLPNGKFINPSLDASEGFFFYPFFKSELNPYLQPPITIS